MNLNITPPDRIIEELKEIDSFLCITCSEQPEEIVQRGNDLAVYIARSGKLLADAKHHLDTKLKQEVFDTLKATAKQAGATSKAINKIIDSLCADEQYAVTWAERINRTATHQLDWCRTLVSKSKEELRVTNNRF